MKLEGTVSGADFFRYQEACYGHAGFDPNGRELIDVTGLTSTSVHIHEMADVKSRDQWQQGSRRALVAPSTLAFGMVMMFKTLAGSEHGEIKIFRDLQQAREWLGLETDG